MRSTIAVDVAAPTRLIFELVRDVERWPELLPHYLDVQVLERHADGAVTARMVAVRPLVRQFGYGIPVTWRARIWADLGDYSLRFKHLGGATAGMHVTWWMKDNAEGCRVSIEHLFEPRLPGWSSFVERLFVRPIATRTLATFKAIAEATAAATSEARRSERSKPPKKTSR